ncbi:MAG TPA: ATP-dependent DNA helicase RecG [Candidatus Woesebacteria bacterium]|nr:ATP-dependent DNA helicase RecG [Candidatus Woesebacteria bacterium]
MLPGIGPKTIQKLAKLKITSPTDLIYHFPHRYLDFSHIKSIAAVQVGENVTITGKITQFHNIFTRSQKNIQKAVIRDQTGYLNLIWFNQPYLSQSIKVGETYSFAGEISLYQNQKTLIAPVYGQYHTGKIIGIYPETVGLSSNWFRKTIQNYLPFLLSSITDPLPTDLLKKYHLLDLKTALRQIHQPTNLAILNQARFRLSLDEILSIQSDSYQQKQTWLTLKPAVILADKSVDSLINRLPFHLTSGQIKVWHEIKADLLSNQKPMNRLLQGDVGAGKTVIAMLAAYLTAQNNSRTIFMAPTEILAQQHFQTISAYLKNTYLLTAKTKLDLEKIPQNAVIISTHAIIYRQKITNVGLLVIDEQHKFGVKQRSFLSGLNPPHTLTMTATPIPRTISLTFLGNLDLSTIETLPQNRLSIKTFVVPQSKKRDCYRWIDQQIKTTKEQAFIVCPFINESENLTTVKSAQAEFEKLQKVFPDQKLALIHGKIKPVTRGKILKKFKENKINILVTTPIIEVGIDYPNATIIVIQSADRFGLASLHQLRGRVGRGEHQSYCYLFTESNEEKVFNRLKFLEKNNSGLKIAEYDLKVRGPGEAFSTEQHGFPSLKLADISDLKLIEFSQNFLKDLLRLYPNFDPAKLIKTTHNKINLSN